MNSYLNKFAVAIHLNTPVAMIDLDDDKFVVNSKSYDYMILATDIPGTQKIIAASPALRNKYPNFSTRIAQQKISQKYAVLRIWIDKDVKQKYPFFIFTDAVEILDSITIYHQMEASSHKWVAENGGGIFELHSYALPDGWDKSEEIRNQLLKEFELYLPELKGYKIKYEYLQVRDDFTAFHTNLYADRAEPITEIPNLYLCGDWIKLPVPAMLMEAAATSALYATNAILIKEKLQEEPVYSVPQKGIFA